MSRQVQFSRRRNDHFDFWSARSNSSLVIGASHLGARLLCRKVYIFVFESRKRNRTRAKTSASIIRDALCRQRRDDASIEGRCLWVARVVSHPLSSHMFLTQPTHHSLTYLDKMLKVITCFPFRGYPHMTAAWFGAQCHHHSRLCSSEAVTSRTRCWTPARPSVASVVLPARCPLLLVLLSAFRSTFPRIPGTQVPRSSSPYSYHSIALLPQLSVVIERGHATRELYSRILRQLAAPFPVAPGGTSIRAHLLFSFPSA